MNRTFLNSNIKMLALFIMSASVSSSAFADCGLEQWVLPNMGERCIQIASFQDGKKDLQVWQCPDAKYFMEIIYSEEAGEFNGCPIVGKLLKSNR